MSKPATFAARLKALRQKAELTQAALAARLDMAPAQLGQLEQGAIVDPRWSTVCRLADALAVDVGEFRR